MLLSVKATLLSCRCGSKHFAGKLRQGLCFNRAKHNKWWLKCWVGLQHPISQCWWRFRWSHRHIWVRKTGENCSSIATSDWIRSNQIVSTVEWRRSVAVRNSGSSGRPLLRLSVEMLTVSVHLHIISLSLRTDDRLTANTVNHAALLTKLETMKLEELKWQFWPCGNIVVCFSNILSSSWWPTGASAAAEEQSGDKMWRAN